MEPQPGETHAFSLSNAPIERKTIAFAVENSDDLNPNEFKGYAAVFGNLDNVGDIIAPGAFTETLSDFMVKGAICWQHKWETPIGRPLEAREDSRGLFVKGLISETTTGKDALILMRDDVVKLLSIGYKTLAYRILSDAEGISMLGDEAYQTALKSLPWDRPGIRLITKAKLFEVSPVTIPANDDALILGVKGMSQAGSLPFSTHFETALAVVGGVIERANAINDLRVKEGRVLSAANRDRIQTMRDCLAAHVKDMDALMASAETKDDGDEMSGDASDDSGDGEEKTAPTEDVETKSDAPETGQPDDAEAKALAEAALADEARSLYARFLQTEARLSGALDA